MSTCTNGRQNSCCLKCNNVSLQLSKYLTRWTKWDQMDWPKLTSQPRVVSDRRKFDSNLAWWLTLARCGRSSNVQTRCHHAQMSAWQGSAVPCRLLHTGHRCCRQAVSQVSHTATDGGATTSAILLDAEHSLCTVPWSGTPCRTTSAHSRTLSPLDRAWKPGFSPDTSVLSALETFVTICSVL